MPSIGDISPDETRPPQGEEQPPQASPPPPPKATPRGAAKSAPKPPPRDTSKTPQDRKLAQAVANGYQTLGGVLIGVGMRFDDQGLAATGLQTMEMAEVTADAWLDLANQNPKVKAWLRRMTEASASAVLIGCHVSMLVPLLASRGAIPPQFATAFTGSQNGNGSGPE